MHCLSPPPLFLISQVALSEPRLIGLAEFELDRWSVLVMFSCALCKIRAGLDLAKVTLPKASSVCQLIHNFDKMPKDNVELTVFVSILGI